MICHGTSQILCMCHFGNGNVGMCLDSLEYESLVSGIGGPVPRLLPIYLHAHGFNEVHCGSKNKRMILCNLSGPSPIIGISTYPGGWCCNLDVMNPCICNCYHDYYTESVPLWYSIGGWDQLGMVLSKIPETMQVLNRCLPNMDKARLGGSMHGVVLLLVACQWC